MSTPPLVPDHPFATPPIVEPRRDDPPWGFFHVLMVALFTGAALLVASILALVVLRIRFGTIQGINPLDHPVLMLGAQGLAYLLAVVFILGLIAPRTKDGVWQALRFVPLPTNGMMLLLAGAGLALGVSVASKFLPIPDKLPIEEYFRTTQAAWAMTFFGVAIAPFFEELFFRGLLYPVLERRFGIPAAIVITALPFAFIHAAQLSYSWAPLLLLFLVGALFTWTRARTGSLAASWLLHVGYNATLFVMLFVQTGGYRNFEKLGS